MNGGGIVNSAYEGSFIDNVHLVNGSITKNGSSGYAGGIVRYATTSTISNCSVKNLDINVEVNPDDIYIGGIVGRISNSSIENCYVQGLSIIDKKGVNSGIGGIAGSGLNNNSIINCYSEGKINSQNTNVGGIIGNAAIISLENCYSKVNISTTNSNAGGIVGYYTGTDVSEISNNLSIGNIYTTSGLDALNRIVGSNSDTVNSNYAYENQLLNGYKRADPKGATLLNKKEILELDLEDSYNYEEKEDGILPKLYNTEGTELLPNQEDILVDDNIEENVDLEVESIEATKPNTTEAEIVVRIKNPEEIEITGIEIEDMTISSVTRNVAQNGITSITVRSTPNRYYDSYKLIGIKYKDEYGEEKTKKVENEIQVQFYKEIYTFEDWQAIEEGTYQNYRLMADIDFGGRTNIKNNITLNRLEAENRIYTLKNINLSYNTSNAGLINNVKTNLKNIGFENIILTNTAETGNYFGLIASNNGNIENLQITEVSIDGTGMNYVGVIGRMNNGNIENVVLKDVNVKGKDYIGGLVGDINIQVYALVENISGYSLTIESDGNYVGGLIGRQEGNMVSENTIRTNNLSIDRSNITGKTYTGGILGYVHYGNISFLKTNDSTVSGGDYVGGVFGSAVTTDGNYQLEYFQTSLSIINGTGNQIGGISGYFDHGFTKFCVVNDTEVNAPSPNSTYIGGIFGRVEWTRTYRYQVYNVDINSNGRYVGGFGNSPYSSIGDATIGYIEKTNIKGGQYVGGIYGIVRWANVGDAYVNADIKASLNTAGGIVGYLENSSMTAAQNAINLYRLMVADTSVTAPTEAGGYLGDIAKEIYREAYLPRNTYIDADVTSENTSTGSLLIGGRPDENSYIENTYVYKYSTLNGNYVYATNDNIGDSQYLVRTDLEDVVTLRDKVSLGTTFNYTPIQTGKYPKIADSYLYYPELQTGVDLPTDPEISSINSLSVDDETSEDNTNEAGANINNIADKNGISTQSIEALPTWTVYPTKVDEVNIDFSSVPEGVSFSYYVNGEEKETVELTKKSYTFKYNYQDTLEIKLTKGQDNETITITPEDVRSNASLVGNNNAYLLGSNLYINGELQPDEYVNVYDGYALNSSGQVVDIATKQMVINAEDSTNENVGEAVQTALEQTTKPLHTYDYKGSSIEVYGTYSTVDGNVKLQIYNVRNGQLSAISNNVDMKIGNSIIDNYNDKEYQTILNTSGELVDLKEQLQYPNNFLSGNIKQIVQNTDAEKPEMMVLYNTGKVIVFNYVTGKVVYENDEKADSGLVSYLTRSFSNIWNDYEDKQQEYAKSKELEAKLAKLPVEEAIKENTIENITSSETNTIENNNVNTLINANTEINSTVNNNVSNTTSDDNYITVYNADTGEYEVYSEDEILNGEGENPISETEKIKENGLEGVYGYNTKEESKPQANGAIIVVSIIAVAIIALVILRKVIVKNNNKKEKRK